VYCSRLEAAVRLLSNQCHGRYHPGQECYQGSSASSVVWGVIIESPTPSETQMHRFGGQYDACRTKEGWQRHPAHCACLSGCRAVEDLMRGVRRAKVQFMLLDLGDFRHVPLLVAPLPKLQASCL
jgi:hypothetical protein